MIKDGKYRYTLQFGMESEAERRAGSYLEQLGNRKSPFIVAAINEYLENHPEPSVYPPKAQLALSDIDPRMLEAKIRQIVEEHFASEVPQSIEFCITPPESAKQISNDILDMLDDLDCFA